MGAMYEIMGNPRIMKFYFTEINKDNSLIATPLVSCPMPSCVASLCLCCHNNVSMTFPSPRL